MAELKLINDAGNDAARHVIFIHGLNGDIKKTWLNKKSRIFSSVKPVFWPSWLAEDIDNTSIWSVGYNADKSRWFGGKAMHLVDRGANVFERILVEPKLQAGELIFVGHSLGGLVIKQILRVANDQEDTREEALSFEKRVRRVAFLGTPHFGAPLSSAGIFFRLVIRPSYATYSLAYGDPNLHALNNWYRSWSTSHKIEHLILEESELTSILGPLKAKVVPRLSSDPGLLQNAVQVDSNHENICKPIDKESEIYAHIKHFVSKVINTDHRQSVLENSLNKIEGDVVQGFSNLSRQVDSQPQKTAEIISQTLQKDILVIGNTPHELVDKEIDKKLSAICRSRFYKGFDSLGKASNLAKQIISGNLFSGSPSVRCKALAWCSRIQAQGKKIDDAIFSLEKAKELAEIEEIYIAEAFILAEKDNISDALMVLLGDQKSMLRYSAAFMMMSFYRGSKEALEWMKVSEILFDDLDLDGKILFIVALFEQEEWDNAYDKAISINKIECRDSPAMLNQIALANLVLSIPIEYRSAVLFQIPFASSKFPLASTRESIDLRRTAMSFFSECSRLALDLECNFVANYAEDYSLWLELRDPKYSDEGMKKLQKSMSGDKDLALRRLPLAYAFNIDLDLEAIENLVDSKTVSTAGGSYDAGMARFVLILTKSDDEIIQYIERHREQLEKTVGKNALYSVEVEALSKKGLITEAEQRFNELEEIGGVSTVFLEGLKNVIYQAKGEDPLTHAREQYEKYPNIGELSHLVNILEEKQYLEKLNCYSEILFNETKSLSDAERVSRTKSILGKYKECYAFLENNTDLVYQSSILHLDWAWALFQKGDLSGCRRELEKLKSSSPSVNTSALWVNLSIASGDWESLSTYIDDEWNSRAERTPKELLGVSVLAKAIQPKRAKDLILSATEKGKDDPDILASAYFNATRMGWENEASNWLNTAVKLSGDDGPMQMFSLEELSEKLPEWRDRDEGIWKSFNNGEIPAILASKHLNFSLIEFYLFPAINNKKESDARFRSVIPLFGFNRSKNGVDGTDIAVDITAIITLASIDILDLVLECFSKVVIAHSTMRWLFNEKQKVAFHQPSQFEEARVIQGMLSRGEITAYKSDLNINIDLAQSIGSELADFVHGIKDFSNTTQQKLIVRPYPVHEIGSFLNEEVDLSEHYDCFVSCSSVIYKLRYSGVITESEMSRALRYLGQHEAEWPKSVEIKDDAILFLDSLSISYFNFTSILEKLVSSSLKIFIHDDEVHRVDRFLRHESITFEADNKIEVIRNTLSAGIESGKVVLSVAPDIDKDRGNDTLDPTKEISFSVKDVDALIADDRFLNSFGMFSSADGETPIHTTLDILDVLLEKNKINQDQWMSCRVLLRQSGCAFIPITVDELNYQLEKAPVIDACLKETAELKSIREGLLQLKMSRIISLPKDADWLIDTQYSLFGCLKKQWLGELSLETSIARSDWLLSLIDYRGWAHFYEGVSGVGLAQSGSAVRANLVLSLPENISLEYKKAYWKWLERSVIEPLKFSDPNGYSCLIDSVREQMKQIFESVDSELEDNKCL